MVSKRKRILKKFFQWTKTDNGLIQLFVSVSLNCLKQQDVLNALENMQWINKELKTKSKKKNKKKID